MAKKESRSIERCTALALPVAERLGLELWDVRFEKEGSDWFLRYFIDKEGGVGILDCENFSRAIDPVLDEADPIEQSYVLEVSSPGVERELRKPWQFERYLGRTVKLRLIRAQDSQREFIAPLAAYDETADAVTLLPENAPPLTFSLDAVAYIRLYDAFDYKGVF